MVSSSLRRLVGRVDRLGHTTFKGSDNLKAAGKKVKDLAGKTKDSFEKSQQRRRDRDLARFKRRDDERRMKELRVYGRELTAKERVDFDRYRKDQTRRKQAKVDAIFGGRTRSKAPVRKAGAPKKSGYDFIAGGHATGKKKGRRLFDVGLDI